MATGVRIIVVFIFHNARFFDLINWEVKNKEVLLGPTIFALFVNFWIMPLFFMLAGGGVRFALEVRTTMEFIRERFWRLVVPYLFGIVILISPQYYLEFLSKGWFDGTFLDFLPWYFGDKLFAKNFSFDPVWFSYFGHHLWFLAVLFVISVIALPIVSYLKSESGDRFIKWLAAVGGEVGGIYYFIVPLAFVEALLRPIYSKYSSWTDFIFWFIVFIFGYIFFSDHRFVESADRHKYISLSGGVLLLVLFLVLSTCFLDYLRMWWDHPDYSMGCIFFHSLWAVTTWLWLMFFLGAGKAFLNFGSTWLNRLNEAVMPFYMLHQTIILIIGFQVIQWPVGIPLKYLVISSSSLVVVVGIYYLLIMRFNWLRVLFGMKPLNRIVISQDRMCEPSNG